MAPTSEEELGNLLTNFDQIYEDFKNGVAELHVLKSNCNDEITKREALEFTCTSLKLENERLTKLYTESLNKLAVQLERRVKCQTLEEELKRVNDERLIKEDERRKVMELITQVHVAKVKDLQMQIRGLLYQNEANEATRNHLSQDLAMHKTHIHALTTRLERVCSDVESKYHHEIQDLKDCLLVEQEEKNELNKKLQNLEKQLLFSRTRLAEQHQDLNSNRNVEMLKEKIMRLRKENEVLKRQINSLKEG